MRAHGSSIVILPFGSYANAVKFFLIPRPCFPRTPRIISSRRCRRSSTQLPLPPSLLSPNERDEDDAAGPPPSPMSTTLASTVLPSSTAIAPAASDTSYADASSDEETLGTSSQAIIACNSISVAACVLVIVIYVLLYRKHTRLMQRTSLVLSVAMSVSDLLLHVSVFFTVIDDKNEVDARNAQCLRNALSQTSVAIAPRGRCLLVSPRKLLLFH